MNATFNLITDPWLLVEQNSGERLEVGLQEALLSAHKYSRLEDSSPLVQGGVHRLLLAALHRALSGPKDTAEALELLRAGRFPEAVVRTYLERYKKRFELLDDEHPFFQVVDLDQPADKLAPVTRLIAEAATGNNATLFDHSADTNVRPRSAAEVALLLVAHQTFALGGGRSALGYTAHAPVATAALTLVLGDTLFETLALNLVPYNPEGDAPVWEQPPLKVADVREGRAPLGICDRYTWPSRAIRIVARAGRDGVHVSHLAYAAGLSATWTDDPMVSYREVEKIGTLPFSLRQNRAIWRDFRALVPTPGSAYTPPAVLDHAAALTGQDLMQKVMVVGLVSDKAKMYDWRTEVFPLPRALLEEETIRARLGRLLETADTLGRELASVQRRVAEALLSLKGSPDRDAVKRLADSLPLSRAYWSGGELAFDETLAKLASQEVETLWNARLAGIAENGWRELVRAVGPTPRALRALGPGERLFRYALRVHTQRERKAA